MVSGSRRWSRKPDVLSSECCRCSEACWGPDWSGPTRFLLPHRIVLPAHGGKQVTVESGANPRPARATRTARTVNAAGVWASALHRKNIRTSNTEIRARPFPSRLPERRVPAGDAARRPHDGRWRCAAWVRSARGAERRTRRCVLRASLRAPTGQSVRWAVWRWPCSQDEGP